MRMTVAKAERRVEAITLLQSQLERLLPPHAAPQMHEWSVLRAALLKELLNYQQQARALLPQPTNPSDRRFKR